MQIEFLYWADCPSHEDALERLRAVMAEQGIVAPILMTQVVAEAEAVARRFIGSPTIRIDGADIDPTAPGQTDYQLTCRVYARPDGRITPLPPREMIAAALRRPAD